MSVAAWVAIVAAGSGAGSVAAAGAETGTETGAGSGFSLDWDDHPDQRWAGPSVRPNRLFDWRVRGGRLECVSGGRRLPIRTAHVLSHRVAAWAPGMVAGTERATIRLSLGLPDGWHDAGWEIGADGETRVRRDSAAFIGPASAASFRGLLIGIGAAGAGGSADTWRRSLTQHRPGPGGGMLVVVDDHGRPLLLDFERAVGGGGGWTINGALADGEARRLEGQVHEVIGRASDERGLGAGTAARGAGVTLRVRISSGASDGRAALVAETVAADRTVIGRVTHPDLAIEQVVGGVAFVSHRGAVTGGEVTASAIDWFDDVSADGDAWSDAGGVQFGPVVSAQYLLHDGTLRLTAQGVPFDDGRPRPARLEAMQAGAWRIIARADFDADACTWRFVARGDDVGRMQADGGSIRIRLGDGTVGDAVDARDPAIVAWSGAVRPEPAGDRAIVIASLNCQKSWTGVRDWTAGGVWYPHEDTVAGVGAHDPDLVVFTGDQLYEGDVTGAIRRPADRARLDYLDKWLRFCVSFGPLVANRPSLSIPDDHDVYHGNIWGAGGRAAVADRASGTTAQDSGGYVMPAEFVRMVHRTQVSHLPDPVQPAPIGIGIVPWTTRFEWGGASFAVIADRMFKAAPRPELPEFDVRNGWIQAPGIRPQDADRPRAPLLGADQERFLAEWATDFTENQWAKVMLSATPLAAVATLPPGGRNGSDSVRAMIPAPGERVEGWSLAADFDTNAWPMSGRRRALEAIRPGAAVHLCGDQHLGSLVQYGIDRHGDAGYVFCSPAIANTWPRRWYPPNDASASWPGAPWWAGDRRDGFGNLMTVHAVANPQRSGREPAALHDRMPGYGIVRLDRARRQVTFEAWPRAGVPTETYPEWPRTVGLLDNLHGDSAWALAPVVVESVPEPVVIVRDAAGVVVAAARLAAGQRLPVPGRGPWTLDLGEPGTDRWRRMERMLADPRVPVHRTFNGGEPAGSATSTEPAPIIVRWE